MISGEWALVFFTLLTQCAIGIWIVAIVLRASIAKKINQELAAQLTGPAILLVGPIMAVALLISLFHLGTPLLAYGSIANLGTSWLSREIIFSGLFLFLWIAAYLNYRKGSASSIIAWINAVVGLLAIYSMASIYHATIIPAWSTSNTYIAFFATTLVLGSIATATLVGFSAKDYKLDQHVVQLLSKVSFLALLAVILQIIFVVLNISTLKGGIEAAQSSAQLLQGAYSVQLILHGLLGIVGGLLFALLLFKNSKKETAVIPISTFLVTFLIILASELLGRYLFYASGVPIAIS